jgi:DNA polymerase-3 subunit alpha
MPATQFNMKWVESAGSGEVRLPGPQDPDGARSGAKHLSKRRRASNRSGTALPLDDAKTYELMATGQTVGVFQLESRACATPCARCAANSIEDVTALVSLYRPGPMENIPAYRRPQVRPQADRHLHPSLAKVLTETYGIIVYQEQVMKIAQILAGYSARAKPIFCAAPWARRRRRRWTQQRARFISGASRRCVGRTRRDHLRPRGQVRRLRLQQVARGRLCPTISYQTGWLKANAPVEFFAASMSLDMANTDKLAVFYQDAKRFGVKIRAPDVNVSGSDFEVENGEVLYALGAIRNVGLQAMQHVVEVREAGGPFRDIFDFVERIDPRQVNKRTFETLARAGAFDAIHENRAQLVDAADLLSGFGQSVAAQKASDQAGLFGDSHDDLAEAQKRKMAKRDPWTPTERLDEELAAIGFYLSGHPLDDMVEALRRRRTDLYTDAVAKAMNGAEALRMAGIVRRKQEKPGRTGEKFAFVTLSDPTGEYEVLFPPESLRRCRDVLEPGKAVAITVRAKASDGEVRFFGDTAEPVEKAVANVVAGVRVHLAPRSAEIDALKRRLEGVANPRGGEVVLVAGLGGGREVELKLPGRFTLDGAVRGAIKTAPGVVFVEDL